MSTVSSCCPPCTPATFVPSLTALPARLNTRLHAGCLSAHVESVPGTPGPAWTRGAAAAVQVRPAMVAHLDDGRLGAAPLPHRAELEPDIAAADNDEPARYAIECQRTGRRDD